MCAMADLVQPSPEQLEAFLRVAADALRVPPDVMIDVFGASLDPGDCRVVVEDGRPVAGAYSLPALQSFGGRLVSCSAVSCVAVAPDRRGGGRASTLMAGLLALMHERGHVVSTLHPANLALYRRAGYEAAARELHATVRLHELLQCHEKLGRIAFGRIDKPAVQDRQCARIQRTRRAEFAVLAGRE